MLNQDLIDGLLLLITLVATPAFCFFIFRQPAFCQKKGFIFFLAFLAMYPLLNMLAHIIVISTLAIINATNGAFTYDFRFYSLMLYGVIFMLLNAYSLNRIVQLSSGKWQVCRQLHIAALLQAMLILPSFVLNPLALLPTITSLLMMGRLYLAQKGRKSLQPTYISAQAA